jgi:hypothetical protein
MDVTVTDGNILCPFDIDAACKLMPSYTNSGAIGKAICLIGINNFQI